MINLLRKLLLAIFDKACKIGQSQKLAIAIITAVLWISTIATSLASTNINTLEAFNYIALPSPVENIAPKQLIFQETTNLIADATSWTNESNFLQKDPLSGIIQAFQEAWKQPNIEQSLFNVCRSPEVDTSICLDLLKNEIKTKKQKLIDSGYGTPGSSNGRLCLDLTLKQLGLTLSDFDRWINELEQVRD